MTSFFVSIGRAVLALTLACGGASGVSAQPAGEADADVAAARARINAWKPWSGIWEGELSLRDTDVAGPLPPGCEPMRLRVQVLASDVTLTVRDCDGQWKPMTGRAGGVAPTPLGLVVSYFAEGGAWAEVMHLVFNRAADDLAEVSYLRTVNNWAAPAGASPPPRIRQYRVGEMKRLRSLTAPPARATDV